MSIRGNVTIEVKMTNKLTNHGRFSENVVIIDPIIA